MSGFWWAFISPFLLWRLLQSSLTRFFHVEGCLWGCRLSLRLHWSILIFFVCVFHPFLSCSTLSFLLYNSLHSLSSPCPLFIFARQIKKMARSFLCNLRNDSKEIFQNISKILVISTAMHFKLFFFSHGDKNVAICIVFKSGATESRET